MTSLNTSKLKLVNPKHSEKINTNIELLVNAVKSHVYATYMSVAEEKSMSFQFILFVLVAIESCAVVQSSNPMYRLDKKAVALRILKELFPSKYTPEYEALASEFIQYSWNSGHIKASSLVKAVKHSCMDYLLKKA